MIFSIQVLKSHIYRQTISSLSNLRLCAVQIPEGVVLWLFAPYFIPLDGTTLGVAYPANGYFISKMIKEHLPLKGEGFDFISSFKVPGKILLKVLPHNNDPYLYSIVLA